MEIKNFVALGGNAVSANYMLDGGEMVSMNHYASLAAAVADINAGVRTNAVECMADAKVKVTENQAGEVVVTLLEDISENTKISIGKDLELVLNGKTLTLVDPESVTFESAAYLDFAEGTDCTINGEVSGSAVTKTGGSGVGTYLINSFGKLTVSGGSYTLGGNYTGAALGVKVANAAACLMLRNCQISVNNDAAVALAIQALSIDELVLTDTAVTVAGAGETIGIVTAGAVAAERMTVAVETTGGICRGMLMNTGDMLELRDSVIELQTSALKNAYGLVTNTAGSKLYNTQVNAVSTAEEAGSYQTVGVWVNGSGTLEAEDGLISVTTRSTISIGVQGDNRVDMKNSTVTVTSQAGVCKGVICTDAEFACCQISAECAGPEATGIQNDGAANVTDSSVYANTYGVKAYAIKNAGTLRMKDSNAFADAPNCHATAEANYVLAIGVINNATAFLTNTNVNGTHSGLQNSTGAKLYVNGGVFTGYSHGGFYFAHRAEGIAYVNDATMRCGNYEGVHDYSEKLGSIYGSFYIGGDDTACDIIVYLDGCTIESDIYGHPFVIRGSNGEQNNTVDISNSTISPAEETKKIRIDNDTLKLNVGIGTNITADRIDNPGCAAFTGALYRRKHPEAPCDGRDYNAIYAYLESKLAETDE